MIWRENRILLGILGALLLGNALFFFTKRVQYESLLQALDAKLQDAEQRLERARSSRAAAEQQLNSYNKVRSDLQTLYNERWATKAQRLTGLIREIKRLAAESQLTQPRTTSFSLTEEREIQRAGGIPTSTVAITFTVQGNYQQIRRLINLLELSNQFVIIDAINLASAGASDSNLTLSLRLKTLFREPPRTGMMINKEM